MLQKLAQWRGSSASKRWAKEWAAEVADDTADDVADDADEPEADSSSTGAVDSEPTLAVLDKVYVDGVSKRRGTVKEISLDNQVKVYIPFEGPARWFKAAEIRKAPAPASSSSASGGSASSAGPPPPPLHPAKKQKPDQSAPSQSSVDAFAGLNDLAGLSDDQRDHVLFQLRQFREANAAKAENERLREENEVLRGELARDGSLLRVAQQRVAQLEKGKGVFFKKDTKGLDKITGYMSKSEFQKRLIELDLITLQPGAKQEGQHVFHIIAVANGGPDHVRCAPVLPRPLGEPPHVANTHVGRQLPLRARRYLQHGHWRQVRPPQLLPRRQGEGEARGRHRGEDGARPRLAHAHRAARQEGEARPLHRRPAQVQEWGEALCRGAEPLLPVHPRHRPRRPQGVVSRPALLARAPPIPLSPSPSRRPLPLRAHLSLSYGSFEPPRCANAFCAYTL